MHPRTLWVLNFGDGVSDLPPALGSLFEHVNLGATKRFVITEAVQKKLIGIVKVIVCCSYPKDLTHWIFEY